VYFSDMTRTQNVTTFGGERKRGEGGRQGETQEGGLDSTEDCCVRVFFRAPGWKASALGLSFTGGLFLSSLNPRVPSGPMGCLAMYTGCWVAPIGVAGAFGLLDVLGLL